MNKVFKIFLSGFSILIVALLMNFFASHLRISTWYEFVQDASSLGLVSALKNQTLISFFFMFVIYPLVLGVTGYFFFKVFKLNFNTE